MTVLPASAPRRRRPAAGALVGVAVLVAVVVLGLVAGLARRASTAAADGASAYVPRPLAGGAQTCATDPSVTGSDQGRQYLRAVYAAQPSWDAVTASLQARGGRAQSSDVVAQAAADRLFLAELTDKRFTGSAREPASRLVQAVKEYVAVLDSAATSSGSLTAALGAAPRLNNERAAASGDLRGALGLPASRCDVLRP